MDTFTHIVLGACIGEAIAGKQLGKKALVIGALAQNIPDIDILASFSLPVSADVLAHRGFTHSILFAILVTPILAWCSVKLFRQNEISFRKWALFWALQILIHIFIDAFNAYGTGWFEPFSHYRVSFNTMFVADPLFTLWPALAMAALLILKVTSKKRMSWVKAGLGLSGLYLVAGIGFKLFIDNAVHREIRDKCIAAEGYFTTPTPLNNLLWYVVVKTDSGYNTGYRSVFDSRSNIDLYYVRRNDSLLKPDAGQKDVGQLLRFSRGYYTVDKWHDTLVFNDLYFGEMLGWTGSQPRFVFHYFLTQPSGNKLIVQRGRFAGWNKVTLTAFFRRMRGI